MGHAGLTWHNCCSEVVNSVGINAWSTTKQGRWAPHYIGAAAGAAPLLSCCIHGLLEAYEGDQSFSRTSLNYVPELAASALANAT